MADASQQSKLRVVEAVLFLAKDGLSSRKLAKLAGLADATEARTLIRELNEIYDQDGRSFRVEDIAGGYMLLTRSNFATWLRRLQHAPAENRLSQTLLETLAIVAYRQPVLRAEIEAIRGVGSSDSLRQLMEMDLIRISGRSEDLGRPYLYGTTRRFLQMFGLRSADRLPRRAWVNELQLSLTSSDSESSDSGAKESSVTASLTTTELLAEDGDEASTRLLHENNSDLKASVDDDDEYFEEDFDDEDDDDEGFDAWEDDGEVDEEESEEIEDSDDDDDEEDDDEDDLEEEQPEWQEVDDDDDGWEDDEDDEESEWDSEEEDDDEDWE